MHDVIFYYKFWLRFQKLHKYILFWYLEIGTELSLKHQNLNIKNIL